MRFKLSMFVLYTVLFELIVWGIFGYAVFVLEHSGWWMLLAFMLSSAQLKPNHFGLPYKKEQENG